LKALTDAPLSEACGVADAAFRTQFGETSVVTQFASASTLTTGVAGFVLVMAFAVAGRTGLARRLAARIREEMLYRHTMAELSRLQDRVLADFGLVRDELPGVARRHARAAR
jgi:uncharacterized protein YjiS (DUF1127 family)